MAPNPSHSSFSHFKKEKKAKKGHEFVQHEFVQRQGTAV